jgi:TRAP-type C4-dicarboxylate transport system permease small subunit
MNAMFERVHGGFKKTSQAAVWVGGLALLLSAVMVTIDVTFRKIFGLTLSGSDEVTGYVFAAATTWAYSFCLLNRSNIRIDALYNTLPLKPRGVLDMVGLVLLAYYVYLLTTSSWQMFVENVEYNSSAQTTLATPLWIPQLFWLSGLGFFFICLVFLVLYGLYAVFKSDWETVSRIAGIKTVEEEISEETFVK